MQQPHAIETPPSNWVRQHTHLLPAAGSVLDVACGSGRHTRYLLESGHHVTAVDIRPGDAARLLGARRLQHDLEADGWPFASAEFDGIVVTHYLHRPLFPVLVDSLKPGGLLLYETFMRGNEQFGRPRNPDYLLRPGELRAVFSALLTVIDYEEALDDKPLPAVRQRIALRKPGP